MTVQDLRQLYFRYTEMIAEEQLTKLRKRKFGFTFEEVFDQHPQITRSIVWDGLLACNKHLQLSDPVRRPEWLSAQELSTFISKIATLCVR